MYEGIGRANDAIHYIPIKSESSETDKARYIAEAKFLRSYFYLRLNQVFKSVPMYKDPITVQNALIERSTEEEIWNFILDDLTDCIKETNLPDKYEKGHKEYGRVTKGAAYALRGKVYMYLKNGLRPSKILKRLKNVVADCFRAITNSLLKRRTSSVKR
ncbi:MAG: RagB/SusD family nutrient uptake outer membrane protein [Bacteroides sp.]|nr:RagB/SusD family nutrient uptake outer membrane protein [Bacteroides sp.]